MPKHKESLDLREGDLVLMNYAGIGENGPVFEVLDKVGALDPIDGADNSRPQNSTSEDDASEGASGQRPITTGSPEETSSQSLLDTLEAQRDALDRVIQQLKRDATGAGNDQSPSVGREIPPQLSQASNGSSSKVQPRELQRRRNRSPTRH